MGVVIGADFAIDLLCRMREEWARSRRRLTVSQGRNYPAAGCDKMAKRSTNLAKASLVVEADDLRQLVTVGGYRNESEAVRAAVSTTLAIRQMQDAIRTTADRRDVRAAVAVRRPTAVLLDASVWIPYLRARRYSALVGPLGRSRTGVGACSCPVGAVRGHTEPQRCSSGGRDPRCRDTAGSALQPQ